MTDWIDWHGGECPVRPDAGVEVEVEFRGGRKAKGPPYDFDWNSDWIIRYRILDAEPRGVRMSESQFEALADWLLEMTRSDISAVAIKRAEITARIAFGLPAEKEQDHERP